MQGGRKIPTLKILNFGLYQFSYMRNFGILFFSLFFLEEKSQVLTHIAGNGNCCNPQNNVPALTSSLYYPFNVAIDKSGNIYIAESNSVRKIDLNGNISFIAGTGIGGYTGDGGP